MINKILLAAVFAMSAVSPAFADSALPVNSAQQTHVDVSVGYNVNSPTTLVNNTQVLTEGLTGSYGLNNHLTVLGTVGGATVNRGTALTPSLNYTTLTYMAALRYAVGNNTTVEAHYGTTPELDLVLPNQARTVHTMGVTLTTRLK